MKIKCPACSKVLNIPDSAAGKVVKCPCGKQLKAPGGAGSTAQRPAPQSSATKRPPPQRPAPNPAAPQANPRQVPQRPAQQNAAAPTMDNDFFSELTDTDLQPIRPVIRPGQVEVKESAKAKAKLAGAASDAEAEQDARKAEIHGEAAKEMWSSIGILVLLGLFEVIWNLIALGTLTSYAASLQSDPTFDGDVDQFIMVFQVLSIIGVMLGALFWVCAGFLFVFPMTSSITALVLFVLLEINALFFNPLTLVSLRDWIFRATIFGMLTQAINNASYYKYVKSGGRDND